MAFEHNRGISSQEIHELGCSQSSGKIKSLRQNSRVVKGKCGLSAARILYALVLGLVLAEQARGQFCVTPANDLVSQATVVQGTRESTMKGQNMCATAELNEPAHAGNTAARSVWYRWTAPLNGAVSIYSTLFYYAGSQTSGPVSFSRVIIRQPPGGWPFLLPRIQSGGERSKWIGKIHGGAKPGIFDRGG